MAWSVIQARNPEFRPQHLEVDHGAHLEPQHMGQDEDKRIFVRQTRIPWLGLCAHMSLLRMHLQSSTISHRYYACTPLSEQSV